MKNTSRRFFLKQVSLSSILLLGGGLKALTAEEAVYLRSKTTFRFVIASDGHYGQPNTPFDEMFSSIVKEINQFHQQHPLHCTIINGDIIHNEKPLLTQSKAHLDRLSMPYHVGKGNHDMVSDAYWQEVWGSASSHTVHYKKNTFIIANTSNEKGEYLSPDLVWLKKELDASRKQRNVFLVLHIPQTKWTDNAIETPAFAALISQYPNVKGVFHGHEHDQDGVKMKEGMPYFFDAHFGGNWGTAYKGFRVVEILDDHSMLTYIMNPTEKINQTSH